MNKDIPAASASWHRPLPAPLRPYRQGPHSFRTIPYDTLCRHALDHRTPSAKPALNNPVPHPPFSRLIPPHRKSTVTKKTQFPYFSFPVSLKLLTSPASATEMPGMQFCFFHPPFTLFHGIRRNGFHKIQPFEKTFRDSLPHDHGGSSEGLWQKSIIAAQNSETGNGKIA